MGFDEANLKSLTKMFIFVPYCAQVGLVQNTNTYKLQPHGPFAIPSEGKLMIYITVIKLSWEC